MSFYFTSAPNNHHFLLDKSILDKNPDVLSNLDNFITYEYPRGVKLSVLKESHLEGFIDRLIKQESMEFNVVNSFINRELKIIPTPNDLLSKVFLIASNALRLPKETPADAANRGDIEALNRMYEKDRFQPLELYIKSGNLNLNVLEWYLEKIGEKKFKNIIEKFGPRFLKEEHKEIWKWMVSKNIINIQNIKDVIEDPEAKTYVIKWMLEAFAISPFNDINAHGEAPSQYTLFVHSAIFSERLDVLIDLFKIFGLSDRQRANFLQYAQQIAGNQRYAVVEFIRNFKPAITDKI